MKTSEIRAFFARWKMKYNNLSKNQKRAIKGIGILVLHKIQEIRKNRKGKRT